MMTLTDDGEEARRCRDMMLRQVRAYGVRNEAVLAAMAAVPRHAFFPGKAPAMRAAYGDHPCSIGHGQTISQPYIVAYMTAALALTPEARVLEIGTGCGYQTAIVATLAGEVYSIERVSALATHAQAVLADLGFRNVYLRHGDGYEGWEAHQPYDSIIVTCAPATVPAALLAQLADGGRMVVPVGRHSQQLMRICRQGDQCVRQNDLPVRFVPMVSGDD